MTKQDIAVKGWIDESFEHAEEVTDEVIYALEDILFARKSISRKEAAAILLSFEAFCKWDRGFLSGCRLVYGVCEKGDDVRVDYNFDGIRKLYNLCAAILKVSTQ